MKTKIWMSALTQNNRYDFYFLGNTVFSHYLNFLTPRPHNCMFMPIVNYLRGQFFLVAGIYNIKGLGAKNFTFGYYRIKMFHTQTRLALMSD